jgi:hypothetical protein
MVDYSLVYINTITSMWKVVQYLSHSFNKSNMVAQTL